jgi:acetolactate synthase small subunit
MLPSDLTATPTYCFSVFAAPEAGVMPRVLELFAKRNLVPSRFHSAVEGADLSIDIQVCGLEADTAEHIARCLRNIVYVERVLTAVKAQAIEARR